MINSYRQGFKDGIPIGLGYLSVSFTFGMMAISMGFDVWHAVLISATTLTSAGQFAALPLMLTSGAFIEMALTQLVINLRYALMSISVSQKLDKSVTFADRLLFAFGNTDEVFAVASSKQQDLGKRYLFGLITAPYVGWTLGTLIGAVAGSLIPLMIREVLGIAIYGMFISIIIPPAKAHKPVAIVIVISIILSCLFKFAPVLNQVSSGFVIIICSVIASCVGSLLFPLKDAKM
ncbi:MAG: AzlC family ABC transporter permease [Oscillospiraceae bacterium]|nr:AzlC family ABC transporter permease [Oscillospiraceae bacterium]